MDKQDKVHGEGNYKASREYNEATKRFVESGKVDEAAEKARPRTAEEEQEMEQAAPEADLAALFVAAPMAQVVASKSRITNARLQPAISFSQVSLMPVLDGPWTVAPQDGLRARYFTGAAVRQHP